MEFTEQEKATLDNALAIAIAQFEKNIQDLKSVQGMNVSRLIEQFEQQVKDSQALRLRLEE